MQENTDLNFNNITCTVVSSILYSATHTERLAECGFKCTKFMLVYWCVYKSEWLT